MANNIFKTAFFGAAGFILYLVIDILCFFVLAPFMKTSCDFNSNPYATNPYTGIIAMLASSVFTGALFWKIMRKWNKVEETEQIVKSLLKFWGAILLLNITTILATGSNTFFFGCLDNALFPKYRCLGPSLSPCTGFTTLFTFIFIISVFLLLSVFVSRELGKRFLR